MLAGGDRARARLGAAARAGHKICASHRGIGGLPGRLALDQPGTRGHYSDAQSVRKLNTEEKRNRRAESVKLPQWPPTTRLSPVPLPVLRKIPATPDVRSMSARGRRLWRSCAV